MDAEERSTEISMEELAALVDTAGADTVAMVLQTRQSPDPRSFLGAGKLQEIKEIVTNNECDLVVIDNELSPSQARAIEEELGVRVVDRVGLDPRYFRPARPHKARAGCRWQLAQYEYLLPRLTGMWTHLERQASVRARRRSARAARAKRSSRPTGGTSAGSSRIYRPISNRCARVRSHAAPPPREKRHADGRARRVYERREIHGAQPSDALGHPGERPPFRYAGHDDAPSLAAGASAGDPALRHRRLHPQAADESHRGVQGHARRIAVRRSSCCTSSMFPRPTGRSRQRSPTRSSASWERPPRRCCAFIISATRSRRLRRFPTRATACAFPRAPARAWTRCSHASRRS